MNKSRLMFFHISLLRRTVLLLSCLFFAWSILVPLFRYIPVTHYQFTPVPLIENHYVISYWSFKTEIHAYRGFLSLQGVIQVWFFDHWFGNHHGSYLGLSWLLLAMFAAQIATLATGMVSVFRVKRIVAAVPAAANLTTIFLMIYQNILLSASSRGIYFHQLGYWLTSLSLALFIINFLLTLALPQRR